MAQIVDAIQRAPRCAGHQAEREDPCDGLDGCEECLTLAAAAVLALVQPARQPLTGRQREVLDWIIAFQREHGLAPNYQQIMNHFGFTSYATVAEHLCNLEQKGWIRREPNRERSITLLET